ncbi:MAG TPA: c-type cytochrome [Burkholderiales bacterium]
MSRVRQYLPLLVLPVAALAACQTTSSTPAASVDRAMARNIAHNCFTCHGPGGRSPGAIPSLDRLSAATIASRLKGFKDGTEPSTVMGRHAKGYSDAEIEAVARYIASGGR